MSYPRRLEVNRVPDGIVIAVAASIAKAPAETGIVYPDCTTCYRALDAYLRDEWAPANPAFTGSC